MKSKLWYHTSESMISVTYDIIVGLWYMILYMITPMISYHTGSQSPYLKQICKQMISMWVYPIAQASWAWQRRGVVLGSGRERKAVDWSLQVLDVCPTPGQHWVTNVFPARWAWQNCCYSWSGTVSLHEITNRSANWSTQFPSTSLAG